MASLTTIFTAITLAFFILLLIKEAFPAKLKKELCVLCAAATLTWASFLTLLFFDLFQDRLILALLLGQSTLGVFYLVESKAKENFGLFRLPFLLTLLFFGYLLLAGPAQLLSGLLFLFALWALFIFAHLSRRSDAMRPFVKKILDCCRRW